MQARQLQATVKRPFGKGQVIDIEQDEYAGNPGAFVWVEDEQAAATAETERCKRELAERRKQQADSARAALRHDLQQQIARAQAAETDVQEQIERLNKQIAEHREHAEFCQEQLAQLAEPPSEQQSEPVPPSTERPTKLAVDLRGGVRRIRGQS